VRFVYFSVMQKLSPIHRALSLLSLGSLVAGIGCYAYIPTTSTGAQPGSEVQLMLTDSGTVVLASAIGPSVGTVDGRLVSDTGGSYLLNVTRTQRRDGTEADWRGERLVIPQVLTSGIAARRFSTGRTALFSTLATGALVAIAEAFGGNGGASAAGRTPGGTQTGK
jgi:hypothetical protein